MKPKYRQQEILKEISRVGQKFTILAERKREIEKNIGQLKARIERIDAQMSGMLNSRRKLSEIHLIQNGIPNNIAKLREKIISEILFSQRKDVKVSESEKALANIGKDRERLQKICPHQFIITKEGCDSFSSYENARYEERMCVVCGFAETSEGSPPYSGVLADKDNRLAKRNRKFFESLIVKDHDVFSKELDYFLELFLNSIGRFGYLEVGDMTT